MMPRDVSAYTACARRAAFSWQPSVPQELLPLPTIGMEPAAAAASSGEAHATISPLVSLARELLIDIERHDLDFAEGTPFPIDNGIDADRALPPALPSPPRPTRHSSAALEQLDAVNEM